MVVLLIAAALVAIAAAVATRWARWSLRRAWCVSEAVPANGRVLLVTAHPDDECMFFAPAVRALVRENKAAVDILCCSRGDADGLGHFRVDELAFAATVLGLGAVTVLDDPELRDGMAQRWPRRAITQALQRTMRTAGGRRYDALLSFDAAGVSGHPNHVAVADACEAYCAANAMPFLELVSAVPKYVGALGIAIEAITRHSASLVSRRLDVRDPYAVATLSAREYWARAVGAMLRHRSQMRWFRWLYILFSRHMHVSVVRVIPRPQ